jgi:hypothetical protein
MHTTHPRRRGVLLALLTVLTVGTVLPASAAPSVRERFVESFEGSFDDCGFDVRFEGVEHVNLLINARGSDGLPYYGARGRGEIAWTDAEVEDSPVFAAAWVYNDRDSRVTDNGDGTFTVLVTVSGRETYSLDGQRLFLNAGLQQFELLVDHGGTPTDPFDDEVVDFLGPVRDDAGRWDTADRDFCEDLTTFLR